MLQLLEPFGIREFVRSGMISLSRGATALGDSGRARMRRVI
jgi:acetolactate synthase small subunit